MKALRKRQQLGNVEAYACACIAGQYCTCKCSCVCYCSNPTLQVTGANIIWQVGFQQPADHGFLLVHEVTNNEVG